MNEELTYHDLKEERELSIHLANESKNYLIAQIIMKNRRLDELERENNELLDTEKWYYRLEHNWNELKRVLNGLLEDENDFYSVIRIRDLLKIIKQIEDGGNNDC